MHKFVDFFSIFTLKDLLDIGIVSVLIYQVLYIIRGTRAVQVFLGLLALALLNWVGHFFNLYSLSWLLDHFFNSFFILLVIIFQDELRSTLANFWTQSSLFSRSKKDYFIDIEEVIVSTRRFSQQRLGALLVFERINGLSNYIETGTVMKSEIHADILFSIFYPKSPLHDGAAIISKGKIQAAGCFLPLSQNTSVDRHFGTRHRAAIGISEISDAVVVVVSEETGNIGICLEGRYLLAKSDTQLREWLLHLLYPSVAAGQTIKELEF
jgi:diadenylate cyclase